MEARVPMYDVLFRTALMTCKQYEGSTSPIPRSAVVERLSDITHEGDFRPLASELFDRLVVFGVFVPYRKVAEMYEVNTTRLHSLLGGIDHVSRVVEPDVIEEDSHPSITALGSKQKRPRAYVGLEGLNERCEQALVDILLWKEMGSLPKQLISYLYRSWLERGYEHCPLQMSGMSGVVGALMKKGLLERLGSDEILMTKSGETIAQQIRARRKSISGKP